MSLNTLQVNEFSNSWETIEKEVYKNAVNHGWWEEEHPNDAEKIALMHSELSEALEAMREGKDHSEHIPDFLPLEEELADVVIRIMDYAQYRKLDLAGAILAKMRYNEKREYKHGGKAF